MIGKVLVANRGEIARRVIRAAHSLGIATAAVYSDADAGALYVGEADESVRLDGTAAADTYLVAELIIDAARAVGADAVHPGYGFLSENAAFAAACEAAGLTFVGPPSEAIRRMGDKLGAKAIMAANGVPTLAGVTVGDGTMIDPSEVVAHVGLPAIIKASAGGGGRGMRIVADPADFEVALDSARREAAAAFGDPTVFIERYLSPARHIEVQVVADRHGNVAHLFERECSIQRRHQKLVEESPSPFVDPDMRSRLCEAAVRAVRAVEYLGVGTVEFVAGADGTFAFLEMNTRLQVEHPVTELVTGVDLVRLQFQIADGTALPREVTEARVSGAAIEVRLCAEDPAAGHLPAAGRFSIFEIADEGLRVDTGVASGSDVPPYYDSMVAKIVSHAPTRAEAAARLARGLERSRLHGVVTNRDMLARVLRSPEFLAGDTTTDFLDRVKGLVPSTGEPQASRAHLIASAVALQTLDRMNRTVQSSVPGGWRNNRSSVEGVELGASDGTHQVLLPPGPSGPARVDGDPLDVTVHGARMHAHGDSPAGVTLDATVAGVRRRYAVLVEPTAVSVDSPLGASVFQRIDPFPLPDDVGPTGGLSAPMPGGVVRLLVSVGEAVQAGDPLLVLEAMKMEHTISSPAAGTVVAVNVKVGDQVQKGDVLAEVEA